MRLVRPATISDLPQLSRLWYEKMVLQQSDNRFKLMPAAQSKWMEAASFWLADPKYSIQVIEENNEIVGCIIGCIQNSPPGVLPEQIGTITDLMVDAHAQKGGVGSLLLNALRDWFVGQGIRQIVAQVPARMAVEQAFWRAQGATEWTHTLWLK